MYIQPSVDSWNGRVDSEDDPLTFRFHQKVRLSSLSSLKISKEVDNAFGLIGFECDAGVKRNQGRTGAAKAPDEIRCALASLPWHLSLHGEVFDVGNIRCEGDFMEKAQANLGEAVALLFRNQVTPIIVGGGHETFYGHYLGVRKWIGAAPRLGIINIDAHFDMRSYYEKPSSGTMFKQILDDDQNCSYFCIGIQQQGNTKALFKTAKQYQVEFIEEDDVSIRDIHHTLRKINTFIESNDYIILTLCMDVIGIVYAPGVSAPSPFGLDPKTVRTLIRHIVSKKKTLSFDISEVNPALDENKKTVSLAARILYDVILNFHVPRGQEPWSSVNELG